MSAGLGMVRITGSRAARAAVAEAAVDGIARLDVVEIGPIS
jgi:hypothetical protein